MIKPNSPEQLAIDILKRSICSVQVGAVIVDAYGRIISWGWNSMGSSGYGECAEAAAIRRANKKRLAGATVYIAGQRKRNAKPVPAIPCPTCRDLIWAHEMSYPIYRNGRGEWVEDKE